VIHRANHWDLLVRTEVADALGRWLGGVLWPDRQRPDRQSPEPVLWSQKENRRVLRPGG
jgi:hypothetical protein